MEKGAGQWNTRSGKTLKGFQEKKSGHTSFVAS